MNDDERDPIVVPGSPAHAAHAIEATKRAVAVKYGPPAASLRVGDRVTDGHGKVLTVDELPFLDKNGLISARVKLQNGTFATATWGPTFRTPLAVTHYRNEP